MCNKCLLPPTTLRATVHNLLRARLSVQDNENWVDLIPGVMLTFNEMTQDQHGFTASQILGGGGGEYESPHRFDSWEVGRGGTGCGWGLVKDLQKRLREVRSSVAPYNRQQEREKENPFRVGELILIFQQPMERDPKLSPKWRGPFLIVKN